VGDQRERERERERERAHLQLGRAIGVCAVLHAASSSSPSPPPPSSPSSSPPLCPHTGSASVQRLPKHAGPDPGRAHQLHFCLAESVKVPAEPPSTTPGCSPGYIKAIRHPTLPHDASSLTCSSVRRATPSACFTSVVLLTTMSPLRSPSCCLYMRMGPLMGYQK
jgi:hypothetical protein